MPTRELWADPHSVPPWEWRKRKNGVTLTESSALRLPMPLVL